MIRKKVRPASMSVRMPSSEVKSLRSIPTTCDRIRSSFASLVIDSASASSKAGERTFELASAGTEICADHRRSSVCDERRDLNHQIMDAFAGAASLPGLAKTSAMSSLCNTTRKTIWLAISTSSQRESRQRAEYNLFVHPPHIPHLHDCCIPISRIRGSAVSHSSHSLSYPHRLGLSGPCPPAFQASQRQLKHAVRRKGVDAGS